MRYAATWADWNRSLLVTWPDRLVRYTSSSAIRSSNATIASALIAPFLVAPRVSTSMPARQVRSAGAQPRAATAFAIRAPSRWARSPCSRPIAVSPATCSGWYTVPKSLGSVSDSTLGWLSCGSPHLTASSAARRLSGSISACGPSTPCITAPPLSNDVAPPSAPMMCADGWHRTAPHGGVAAESAREFAAVPLVTGKTRAVGCSKTVRTTSCRCAVSSSPP